MRRVKTGRIGHIETGIPMSSEVRTIDDVIELFELFGEDWEARYQYLIDLGKTLPAFPAEQKTESNEVRGCTSKVWMLAHVRDGVFTFQADSDAHIVKGLIGLLVILFNNRPVGELATVDVDTVFRALGLEQNLSPNRRNGFFSMVGRLKSYAA